MHAEFLLPCLVFQLAWYGLLRTQFPPRSKQRAWLLTLPVSLLFSVIGAGYIARFAVALSAASPLAAVDRMLGAESALDAFAASYMIVFLSLDLLLGQLDYSEHLQLDTGYIHHAVYLPIYTYMLCNGFTPYLLLGAACEVPTFIMALGTIFPSLRQDLAFGVSFFFTRIVLFIVLLAVYLHPETNTRVRGCAEGASRAWRIPLHAASLLTHTSCARPPPPPSWRCAQLSVFLYLPPTSAALLLHLWWFSKWLKCGGSKKRAGDPASAPGGAGKERLA